MPIIGNPIYQSAFVVDQFSGNGSTVAFTMSVAPAGVTNVLVAVSGVLQDPSTYGVVGNTITFSAAPPSGTGNISCRYLGVPVTGVTTTAYRTVTEFTATASQTTFTPPSYNVGFINVYLNGVLLGSADYTASNGTTVVLATGASAGNLVTVESFQISSVANAIANAAGSVSNSNLATNSVTTTKIADGSVTPAKLSTGGPSWTSGGVLTVTGATGVQNIISSGAGNPPYLFLQNSADSANNYIYCPGKELGIVQADASASSAVYISTQNIARLRVNSAGIVTTPFNPSFNIGVPATSAYTVGNAIRFSTQIWDVTNSYSSSTGRFTAPVAGTYAFGAVVLVQGTSNGAQYDMQLVLNGFTALYAAPGRISSSSPGTTWSNDFIALAVYQQVKMNANDYVHVAFTTFGAGSIYTGGPEWTRFYGSLIG